MPQPDHRTRLKQWLESGEIRLQPLTFPQRELWEASPHPPEDASNNIGAIIHLRGPLTPQGSEAALRKVIERQEVFRLSFLPGKTQPVQMIRNTAEPVLEFREIAASAQSAEALDERTALIFQQPFDLVQGPLYRAEVLRLAPDDHLLVLAIHHAIADGWTLGVFVQDLFNAYLQTLKGTHSALPRVPLSYSEWGAAERALWQPAEIERRAAYWRAELADAPRLWNRRTGPDTVSGSLQRHVSHIPAGLGRSLRELARRNGATLFSTLLTAFQIALSKWTDAEDIVVGTPVANRNSQAVRETMGYCSGIVPLRGRIDPARPFTNSLKIVHQSAQDAFANAMPFAELVRAVGDAAAPGYNPVFEVRFALQNHPVPDVEVAGLSLRLRTRSTGTARFDLACEINEEKDLLEVSWLSRQNLFRQDAVEDLARSYLAVLNAACHSPDGVPADPLPALR